jgi:hypothetical protein
MLFLDQALHKFELLRVVLFLQRYQSFVKNLSVFGVDVLLAVNFLTEALDLKIVLELFPLILDLKLRLIHKDVLFL